MSTSPITQKLTRLIQGLTSTELRYCRRYLGIHQSKSSKYLSLFNNLVEKQKWKEKDLAKKIYGPSGKPNSAFSELKRYLYQLLLKALVDFDKKSTPDLRLDHQLQKSKVLFKRGLYRETRQRIKSLNSKAKNLEEWFRLLELLKLEQQILEIEEDYSFIDSLQQSIESLEILNNFIAFRNLHLHLFLSIRMYALLRKRDKVDLLKKRIDHPLVNDKNWKSQKAQILYYRILSLYAYSTLDSDNFSKYAQKDFELSEKRYDAYLDNTRGYLSALSNLIVSLGLQNQVVAVEKLLPKYLKLKPPTHEGKEVRFKQYYTFSNNTILDRGTFIENTIFLKEQKKKFHNFKRLSSITIRHFYYQYFKIHFALTEYQEALSYLNQCIELLEHPIRQDLQNLYPLLRIITHYELKNHQLLESLTRNFYRQLKKQKNLLLIEKRILRFLDIALNAANRQELQQAFIWLRTELQGLENNPSEAILFKYFPFLVWIDSKIVRRPFAMLIREAYERKKQR